MSIKETCICGVVLEASGDEDAINEAQLTFHIQHYACIHPGAKKSEATDD